jgi:ubiquinone/menaquinone biosynthesis C-methylase UbiE
MTGGDRYFEQAALWGGDEDAYQRQVRLDILDLLPEDARSILDVGCGDGAITNALPDDREVVGLDPSEAALAHVRRPTRKGNIEALPFEDGAFDLVMANDVLEHIRPEDYATALAELHRVAGRYVLITGPHREQLEAQRARCADCGHRYHKQGRTQD